MSAGGTKRGRAGTGVSENEEQLQEIFSQAPVGIAQTGTDGQWLRINDRLCEMLGYSRTELHGKTFLDITHPDDREASLTAVHKLLAGESSSWLKEKRYIRKDEVIVWGRLFTSLVRDQDNQPQYFISVVEDITEQKLIEERLRASEAQLMEAQRLAKVGSWERHIKSDTIHWSEEMLRILGPADGAPSTFATFLNYVHPKDREKILESTTKSGRASPRLRRSTESFVQMAKRGSCAPLLKGSQTIKAYRFVSPARRRTLLSKLRLGSFCARAKGI